MQGKQDTYREARPSFCRQLSRLSPAPIFSARQSRVSRLGILPGQARQHAFLPMPRLFAVSRHGATPVVIRQSSSPAGHHQARPQRATGNAKHGCAKMRQYAHGMTIAPAAEVEPLFHKRRGRGAATRGAAAAVSLIAQHREVYFRLTFLPTFFSSVIAASSSSRHAQRRPRGDRQATGRLCRHIRLYSSRSAPRCAMTRRHAVCGASPCSFLSRRYFRPSIAHGRAAFTAAAPANSDGFAAGKNGNEVARHGQCRHSPTGT